MIKSDKMPESWQNNVGLYWSLSYNQIVSLFTGMGFTMDVEEAPVVKTYQNRKVLSAKVLFTSPDGRYSFDLTFNYGNSNGEGVTRDSRNSLYSIRIKAL